MHMSRIVDNKDNSERLEQSAEDSLAAAGVPESVLKLLQGPPGSAPRPPPQFLGYKSDVDSSYAYGVGGEHSGTYLNDYSSPAANDYTYVPGAGELVMTAGGAQVGVESLAQAAVIFVIGASIIISNIIVLGTFITMPGRKDVIIYYLMSLGVADLVAGVFVVPLSVYPALVNKWVYGTTICDMSGYLEITLWFAQLCTFMWISVDRYLAVRKPLRYETVQTRNKCQCWVVFTWVTSMMLCTPPLLGFNSSSNWDKEQFVCWLDWGSMIAYAFTLVPLILGPTLITIFYTYAYIFHTMRKLKTSVQGQDKEFITALTTNLANPDHAMSFVLVLCFWLSWGPCLGIKTYEYFTGKYIDIKFLHYVVFWLGTLNSLWKSLIYVAMSPKFRRGLKFFLLSLCCKRPPRSDDDDYDDC